MFTLNIELLVNTNNNQMASQQLKHIETRRRDESNLLKFKVSRIGKKESK